MKKYCIAKGVQFIACLLITLAGFSPGKLAMADAQPVTAATRVSPGLSVPSDADPISDPVWMLWGAGQFAAVEGNGSFYLGGVGRVREWATDLSHFVDYGWLDGLNQEEVQAIGISPAGDRWFGGDNGLAVLDAAGQWSYYTTANSGLAANTVDGIAVTADGSVWVSHGLPDGPISQHAPDGSWHWFPNRAVVVAQHYATILSTLQPSRLWTIRGSEVWIDYMVFDGAGWAQRGEGRPAAMMVDSQGTLWVVDQNQILRWNGQSWDSFPPPYLYGAVTALTSAPAGGPYAAVEVYPFRTIPPEPIQLYTFEHEPFTFRASFPRQNPASTILTPPAHEPVLVGSNWFGWSQAGAAPAATDIPTLPAGNLVGALRVDENAGVWLFSTIPPNRTLAGIQRLDDRGTTWLDDDQWERTLPGDGLASVVAFDRKPGGDLWFATYAHTPLYTQPLIEGHLFQMHAGTLIAYSLPIDLWSSYRALQIVDDRRVLLAYAHTQSAPLWRNTVARFDNGGTPQDPADDQWQQYTVESDHPFVTAALDTLQRMWYADQTGIYRYENGAWRQISLLAVGCRLVPAAGGAMMVLKGAPGCGNVDNTVHLIQANDKERDEELVNVVKSDFGLVQSTTLHNAQWAVAPDGAIWFLTTEFDGFLQLHRYDGSQERLYATPLRTSAVVSTLDVDANNHVWVAADDYLWRLSDRPQPDFVLRVQPSSQLMAPGSVAFSTITAIGRGGLAGNVTLAIQGLPSGLSAAFSPNPLPLNHTSQLTFSADAALAEGIYSGQVVAQTESLSHTASLSITVAAGVQQMHLPLVAK